jgi:hypothetical protein
VYLYYYIAWREIKGRPKKCYVFRGPEGFGLGLENKCPVAEIFVLSRILSRQVLEYFTIGLLVRFSEFKS